MAKKKITHKILVPTKDGGYVNFNDLSEEQKQHIRNQCFMWAIIMLAGALLSCFLTPYMAIPTYIIWLVLFFREVHFDNHKAFKKYLLK